LDWILKIKTHPETGSPHENILSRVIKPFENGATSAYSSGRCSNGTQLIFQRDSMRYHDQPGSVFAAEAALKVWELNFHSLAIPIILAIMGPTFYRKKGDIGSQRKINAKERPPQYPSNGVALLSTEC
jgi:hypothetical protein